MADRENLSGVAILVKAPAKAARAVRVNVTVPEDDLERIDRFAVEHGYTRSGFLLRAAKREMEAGLTPARAKARTGREASWGRSEMRRDSTSR